MCPNRAQDWPVQDKANDRHTKAKEVHCLRAPTHMCLWLPRNHEGG